VKEINIKLPLIQDFMSLLAYENPLECPVFHLTSLDYRQQVADNLNRILIGWFTSLCSLYT